MRKSTIVLSAFLVIVVGLLSMVCASCTHEIEMYRVAFNSQGGSLVAAFEVMQGREVDEPEPPTRAGFVFDGWYKESSCINEWDFWTETVESDLTLHAKWIVAHTVSFDSTGGNAVAAIEVGQGLKVREPARPTRVGYVFSGWYREIERENPWDFVNDVVVGNTTLFAKWIALHQVTFDSAGGSAVSRVEDVVHGSSLAAPADPTKSKYVFMGWYREDAYTHLWDFTVDTVVGDMTLHAKWIEPLSLGEIGPAGGYVFYDKGSFSDGWRYLEAAPSGWSGYGTDPGYIFGYYRSTSDGTNLVVGTGTAVGTGKANTALLTSAMGSTAYSSSTETTTTASYAAKVCADYSDGEYDDWFLPSKEELNHMYQNLGVPGLGGFHETYYWSSSENDNLSVWYQTFYNGNQHNEYRYITSVVRPVRAF